MLEDKHNKVSKIDGEPNELNKIRAPIAVIMGHVDSGKTRLIG